MISRASIVRVAATVSEPLRVQTSRGEGDTDGTAATRGPRDVGFADGTLRGSGGCSPSLASSPVPPNSSSQSVDAVSFAAASRERSLVAPGGGRAPRGRVVREDVRSTSTPQIFPEALHPRVRGGDRGFQVIRVHGLRRAHVFDDDVEHARYRPPFRKAVCCATEHSTADQRFGNSDNATRRPFLRCVATRKS